jgi:hypothetical protein
VQRTVGIEPGGNCAIIFADKRRIGGRGRNEMLPGVMTRAGLPRSGFKGIRSGPLQVWYPSRKESSKPRLGIPVKANANSGGKPNGIPLEGEQQSERSDAGTLIVK